MTATGYFAGDPTKLDNSGYVKGDIIAADASGDLQPVTVGPDSEILTAKASAPEGVDWEAGGSTVTPANTVVTEQLFAQASNAGAASTYSRGDHTHGTPAAPTAASVGAVPTTRVLTAGTGLTGGGDLTTDRTFTVSYGTTAGTAAQGNDTRITGALQKSGGTMTGAFVPAVVLLSDAATILVNATLGNHFRVTLGGNRTLGNPTGAIDGQKLLFEIIQSGGGGNTLALDTKFAFGTTITAFTMTSTASKRDFIGVVYNSTADKFYVIALAQGY